MRIDLGQIAIATGLLEPEFELRFVGIQAHCRRGIGTADATPTDIEPLFTIKIVGLDEA